MKLWVDADACPRPIKDILFRLADRREILVTLVANQGMRLPESDFVKLIQVGAGADIADSFVGELPFNVVEGEIFYDYYDQLYVAPNHVSNTTIGNVFNGALRVGFLFD